MENTNIIINQIPKSKIFRVWLEFTKPLHKLGNKEIDVLNALLLEREFLSSKITDSSIVDSLLNSTETRKKIQESLGINFQRYNNIISQLKKKNIFADGKLNKKFIPNIKENANSYTLVFNFKLNK